MLVLSENERSTFTKYLKVFLLAIILIVVFRLNVWQSIGICFTIWAVGDMLFVPLGRIMVHLLFTEVFPKSVSELKHTDKQYQYILELDRNKKIYSYVFNKPLDKVCVRCWKYMGLYIIEVTRGREHGGN